MNTRLSRFKDEQGVAIVIAIATITITAALAVALVAAATTFLHSSTRDASNKRALAAAEAGLSVGIYRFGQVSTSAGATFSEQCVTDREMAWSISSPHCPEATGYLSVSGTASSMPRANGSA